MPKVAESYGVTYISGKSAFYAYYRDEEGNRMNPISLNKLKRKLLTGKERLKPVASREEAFKIATKASMSPKTYDLVYGRTKPASPNFIEYVRMIWDYDNSPYIKRRIKEGNSILQHTCNENINAFNKYIAPLTKKELTLKDIENSNGAELTKIRDSLIDLEINSTTKNKGLQAIRTALDYASSHSDLKYNYKDRVKNVKINTEARDSFTHKEINKILSYYNKNTVKGSYDRAKYLTIALAATTGMRPNEIIAFNKAEIYKVDKKNDCVILKISNSINSDNVKSTRKNHCSTYVATYISLIDEIKEFSKTNPEKSNYFFWNKSHPEKPISNDFFKNVPVECFCKIKLDPEDRKLSFYSLRHTAATLINSSKSIGAKKAAGLLGHKDTQITKKHYIEDTPESAVANFNDIRQLIKLPA